MRRLAWVTDPHFDYFDKRYPALFGRYVADTYAPDALLFTGDIALASSFSLVLIEVAKALGKHVYFVLGNHDYYGQSWANSDDKAERLNRKYDNLTWLTEAGVVELTSDTALVGNEGWYDAKWGHINPIRVQMGDFSLVKDLNRFWRLQAASVEVRTNAIVEHCRNRADMLARAAETPLRAALSIYRKVIFATHVPPFPQNAMYDARKEYEDPYDWLPFYTNKAMGDMLVRVAEDHPDNEIQVVCGHAHAPHSHEILPNLHARTGPAQYGKTPLVTILDV